MTELDRETVEAAGRGDNKAFRAFYDHYAPFIWRIGYQSAGGDQHKAAQIVQDTFVRASASLKKFRFGSAVSTWLYRIAWNRAMSLLARDQTWRKNLAALASEPTGGHESDSFAITDQVDKLLGALAPQDRYLLVAREVDGVSFEELAVITGQSSGALRTRMTRLKQSLRERTPYEYD